MGSILKPARLWETRLWDTTTGKPVGPPLKHLGQVAAVALSADGTTALTMDGAVGRRWVAATGKPKGCGPVPLPSRVPCRVRGHDLEKFQRVIRVDDRIEVTILEPPGNDPAEVGSELGRHRLRLGQ